MSGKAYNLACSLALADDRDEALKLLEKNLRDEQIKWDHVENDDDWENFRTDPLYLKLKKEFGG